MNQSEAFNSKVLALRALMESKELKALILRRNPNLAWAISGRAHVPTTIDAACFDLVITDDSVFAVTNAIEAPRLVAEEFPHGLDVKVVQWWEGRNHGLPEGIALGCDQPGAGLTDLGVEVEMLRASLDSYDQERYVDISRRAALALGEAMKSVDSKDREIDVAARITAALWSHNLEISFLGVAGESRVKKFRHPLPTEALIGSRASASICAKEKGLIASVTRIVTFGELTSTEENEYTSILEVEADLLDATIVGKPFSSVVEVAQSSYGRHGFESDEWHNHHQGGPTGFMPRDWAATPSSARLIQENQPISWNPTGKGWKAEETILASSRGVRLLTGDHLWPSRTVRGRTRPDLLRK
jgi:antitoxin VapB